VIDKKLSDQVEKLQARLAEVDAAGAELSSQVRNALGALKAGQGPAIKPAADRLSQARTAFAGKLGELSKLGEDILTCTSSAEKAVRDLAGIS
jgi:hypothetical protein